MVQSTDTHPKVEAMQVRLLREAGLAKRLQMSLSMSHSTYQMSLANLRRLNPEWSEGQCRLRLVELEWGEALARRVRRHLESIS